MKPYVGLILVLTGICLAAALALAVVHHLTRDRIAQVATQKKMAAIAKVLPDTGHAPERVVIVDPASGTSNVFHVARQGDAFAGAAIEASSPNGYGGAISIMVGINMRREIQAIAILDQKETPGLGAKIATAEFKGRYAGLPIDTTVWKVKKDGGALDAITAATISSRAVTEAVADAVARFKAVQDQLTHTEPLVLENLLDEIH
jgi:Na+-translocating ferredoxin:NAD+ oxidoreductase subunit G